MDVQVWEQKGLNALTGILCFSTNGQKPTALFSETSSQCPDGHSLFFHGKGTFALVKRAMRSQCPDGHSLFFHLQFFEVVMEAGVGLNALMSTCARDGPPMVG